MSGEHGKVDPVHVPESPAGPFDHDRAEAAVRELLLAIGEDPDRDGLRDTPAFVAVAHAVREALADGHHE